VKKISKTNKKALYNSKRFLANNGNWLSEKIWHIVGSAIDKEVDAE
jgi:hypothetical protein